MRLSFKRKIALIFMVTGLILPGSIFATPEMHAHAKNAQHIKHKNQHHAKPIKKPKQPTKKHTLHMSRNTLARKLKAVKPHSHPALSINENNVNQSNLPFYYLSSQEQQVVGYVRDTVRAIHYSLYKLGGQHFDTQKGVYMVDCSSYVDKVLKRIYPNAFYTLSDFSGTPVPTSHSYYQYFKRLPEQGSPHWDAIEEVGDLRPGDILVFRYENKHGHETGGHVMLVMDKPVERSGNYLVRVADSAAGGHTADTRLPQNSGIGIGTLVLRSHPQTAKPYAYAWRVGYRLKKNVKIAMARPVEEFIED